MGYGVGVAKKDETVPTLVKTSTAAETGVGTDSDEEQV